MRTAVPEGPVGQSRRAPTGWRNDATLAAAKLLAGEAEGLTRRAVELGLAGDPMAMKAVTSALADGVIRPGEAGRIAGVVDTFVHAIETSEFEQRLQELEHKLEVDDAAAARRAGSTWSYNRWARSRC
jgi:hypothetical protein